MESAGTFLLSRSNRHVVAEGRIEEFASTDAAVDALRSGRHTTIVGALPFDVRSSAALFTPATFRLHPTAWPAEADDDLPAATIEAAEPVPAEHVRRVQKMVDILTDPAGDVDKVVLARRLRLRLAGEVSPWRLAAALGLRDQNHHAFLADLSAAGGRYVGRHLIGASPELLIRKDGMRVSCHPLAGSAPRSDDPAVDAQRGQALTASSKDRSEHRYVIEALADALAPLCTQLDVPGEPTLVSTPRMWHLGTPIHGVLDDTSLTALDLALAVHPTPAVCGAPTLAARDHIVALEGDRGFYAGAVGWSHREPGAVTDDGEWLVSIRCAELAADGRSAITWAGGGIVEGSDPDDELRETSAKFRTVLDAFGITDEG